MDHLLSLMDIQAEVGLCPQVSPRVPILLTQGKTPHAPACLAPTLATTMAAHLLTGDGMQGRGFGGGDGDRDPRLCCWRVPVADLWVICAGQRWWQEEMCRRSGQGSWGWPGSRWAHPRGCSQGAGTRLGGCSGRGQGAELAPGCPTPRKGSGVPHLHPQPPSLPPPGQESLGSQPGSRCVLVDVDTNPSRTGLCPRARGLPAPKPWGHPLSCCQPGSGAEIGVCGKCLSPWEWDGLQRDPQSRWSQTLRIPPSPTLPALDGVTFVPPIPGPRGAAGTHTGLWGHVQGTHLGGCGDTVRGSGLLHWGCTVGPEGHQDFRGAQGVPRDVQWGRGDGHTLVPTAAPLPWLWPPRRDQRPGLKRRRKSPGAARTPKWQGVAGGPASPPGAKPPPSPSSTANPAGLRSPPLYLCTKDVLLPDPGQYSQLKANLCK